MGTMHAPHDDAWPYDHIWVSRPYVGITHGQMAICGYNILVSSERGQVGGEGGDDRKPSHV